MIALLLACGGPERAGHADLHPEGIEGAECAVCAMDVADQPAPRAQVVYRGGERRYACSIGDLRVLLQAPSPLGRPERVWVETSPAPDLVVRDERPWIPADEAWFVFGLHRPEVMGLPTLVYADREAALAAAGAHQTTPVSWAAVLDTPFDQLPKEGP